MKELNFIEKLLQKELRPLLEKFCRQEKFFPCVVELDPTTICNVHCLNCVNKDLLNKSEFTRDGLLFVIKTIKDAGGKGIIFIGGGEPLMHPNIDEALALAKNLSLEVGMVTNGVLIHKYMDIIPQAVSWIRISLDACNSSTYKTLKGVDFFEKIIKSINSLIKNRRLKVGVSFLIQEGELGNVDEIFDTALLADRLCCDYFEYKPSVNSTHHLHHYTHKSLVKIRNQIELIKNYNFKTTRVICPKSMDFVLNEKLSQLKDYNKCHISNFRFLITPQGVYSCPYKRGLKTEKIDSIDQIKGVIDLERILARNHEIINPSTDCLHYCIRHDQNILLNALRCLSENSVDLLRYIEETDCNDIFL